MHLKSLEIQGFKSFPERTVIDFHEGVTAIVGPNGSGKSNVTDAIRWVLGEQSVKTLRGARMEDIIFTGTQSRKAMSFAEVTMTIDNEDQKLPYDYAEIQITRRLYRSGESEYLLNKTHCRLKDIVALFMDTGLGRDGYSIVGQGKVDDILSHRSEDRRKIFEEASGIVKYKTRKEEAEKRLMQTDQNLLRINDIIQELSEQIEPLSEQAQSAAAFLDLKEKLKKVELAYMLDQADQLEKKRLDCQQERQLLELDLEKQQNQMTNMREENRQTIDALHELDDRIEEKREQINRLNQEISTLSGEIALNEEKTTQLKDRIASGESKSKEAAFAMAALETDLSGRQNKLQTLQRQRGLYQKRLSEAEAAMAALQQNLSRQEKELEQWKVELDHKLESLYEKKSETGQLSGQMDLIGQRIHSLELDLREQDSDRSRLQFKIEEAAELFQSKSSESKQARVFQDELQQKFEAQRENCRKLSIELEEKKQSLRNAVYKLKTLENMEKSHEGYQESVRHLMKMIETQPQSWTGVRGTLGELIQVDEKYERAIEIALGAAVQNIVTDDDQTASRLIEYLKTSKAGRATFLPILQVRSRPLDAEIQRQLLKMEGYLGAASERVQYDPELREIVQSLLGRVVIAENLDLAREMAKSSRFSTRIVTLEGDVINPGGSMTGGSHRQSGNGLLGRSRDIARLKTLIEGLNRQLPLDQRVLTDADSLLQRLSEELDQHLRQLAAIDHEMVRMESQLEAMRAELAKMTGRREMIAQELVQLREQNQNSSRDHEQLLRDVQILQQRIDALRNEISVREGDNQAEILKRDEMREQITGYRVSLNSVDESLQSMQEITERIEHEKRMHQEQISRQSEQTSKDLVDIEKLGLRQGELDVRISQCKKEIEQVSDSAQIMMQDREAIERRQAGYYDQLELAAGRLSSIQNEIVKTEAKSGRLETQLDDLKNRLWEEYELTVQQASAWRQPVPSQAEANRQILDFKTQIKDLGPVNLTAIESYASLQERFAFMSRQRDDIEAARHKLTTVIADLTEAMKARFVEHFHLINENFRQVFSELFGGGMAELNLENDLEVLSCGIEIKAQPPGKRLQNLTLLSGGERCLTAIALLFAILKLRPTPFCVLDEVEAALDDANVSRFTDYIRNYSEASQFILVTHRKGTMEAADRLYGVTMQERGISRILSMKLSDEEIA